MFVKDTYPIKDFTSITQIGLKAYNLALTYKAEIDPRLPGTIDALGQDLDTLGVVIPGAVQARHEARAATTAQNTILRQGYTRVRALRQMIRKAGAPRDAQHAYGVGQPLNPRRVRDVKAALQQIVDRAQSAPSEAAAFGVIASDVTALSDLITQIADADMTQEQKRASAPLSTKERNLTANRVLQAAALIAGTGMRAFADDPLTHATFEALMASTRKTAPSKDKKAAPRAPEGVTADPPRASAGAPNG